MNQTHRHPPLAVVDVEGNGQNPPDIVELAIVPVDDGQIDDYRGWLVRPPSPISGFVTRNVHGISNDDVADAPAWSNIAAEVEQALAGRLLVAHNAGVEQKVLARHLPAYEPEAVVDTLRLARRLWPDLPKHGLDDLLAARGIRIHTRHGQRHRAGYDAHATAQLVLDLAHTAGDLETLIRLAAPNEPARAEPDTLW